MNYVSPWKLTPREAEVLDALCEHGSAKLAARYLGIAVKTAEEHSSCAKQKISGGTGVVKLLIWDRWRRGRKCQGCQGDKK